MIYIFIILFGAAFGSFFNVCISRIPKKESIIFPVSHCPVCNKKLNMIDNIPIISFIALKGRCRHCSAKIHPHYLIVELFTSLIFLLLYMKFGLSILFAKYIIFISFGLIIVFIDLFHKIIPDKLSLPMIPLGLGFSLIFPTDISFKNSLIAGLSSFVIFLLTAYFFKIITKKDALGGGDIKLIAGIGTFVGIFGTIFTIVFGSVFGLIILSLIKYDHKKEFPFGPFLLLASFVYVIFGDLIFDLYFSLIS